MDILIEGQSDEKYKDLAKDAKGDFRYLIPVRNSNNLKKIMDIQLLRRSGETSPEDIKKTLGFDGRSRDINENRSYDYIWYGRRLILGLLYLKVEGAILSSVQAHCNFRREGWRDNVARGSARV